MNLAIDNIKIKYSQEGYLPNYPHHLISDEEMCNAFIGNDLSYFYDNYPLLDDELESEYDDLINAIKYHIQIFLDKDSDSWADLPDWVYSYMLGHVISVNSDWRDRHRLLVGLEDDNLDDDITASAQLRCYYMSRRYVNKLSKAEKEVIVDGETIVTRPPALFGEPHIVKLLRLNEVQDIVEIKVCPMCGKEFVLPNENRYSTNYFGEGLRYYCSLECFNKAELIHKQREELANTP